jgi:hypothetical protein
MLAAMLAPRRWLIGALLLGGCGTTPPQREEPTVAVERSVAPEPSPSLTEPLSEPPKPYVPDPEGFGDSCEDDGGCGWDDPCNPTRCVAATQPADIACDKSSPAPGECSCVAGRCSLRPSEVPAEGPSCRLEPCGLDQGAGRCVAGSLLGANRQLRDLGPACPCDEQRLECRFVWVESIACKSVDDCWVSDGRPHFPIARPKSKRSRELSSRGRGVKKFRPCSDAEVGPACVEGRCSVVAYRC